MEVFICVICLTFLKGEPVRSMFFPNRASPYIFMADSLLCLLRWPEEPRKLTAKKNYFRTALVFWQVCLGFFTVSFIFSLFFISFSLLLVVEEWSSELSSSTVYNPCTKICFFEDLTVWGINARLQPCVPLLAGVQDLLHPELHCHRASSDQKSWATVRLWTALPDCFLRLSWTAKYEISWSDLLEWADDVPQRSYDLWWWMTPIH